MSRIRGSIANPARVLAALLAVLALVSLVHWHPLFEDSGAETLHHAAANQCAACATGMVAPDSGAETFRFDIVAGVTPDPATADLGDGRLRGSIPRAPPC